MNIGDKNARERECIFSSRTECIKSPFEAQAQCLCFFFSSSHMWFQRAIDFIFIFSSSLLFDREPLYVRVLCMLDRASHSVQYIQIKWQCTEFIICSAIVQLCIDNCVYHNVHLAQWTAGNSNYLATAQFVFYFSKGSGLKRSFIYGDSETKHLCSQTSDGRTWHVPSEHESPVAATVHIKMLISERDSHSKSRYPRSIP